MRHPPRKQIDRTTHHRTQETENGMDDARSPQDRLEGISYTTDTVQELLAGVTFPVDSHTLAQHLEAHNAPEPVVEGIRTSGVPRFDNMEAVMDVVGGFAV